MATNEVTAASPARTPETPKVVEPEHLLDRAAALHERIARRAFRRFLDRGGAPGHELEDWFEAERELRVNLPVEVRTLDDSIVVRAETPGFKESELYVSVESDRVAIGGWREETTECDVGGAPCTEASSEEIFREVALPCPVETSSPEIVFGDGVLTVTLAKSAPAPAPAGV